MAEIIASGTKGDLSTIQGYEGRFNEGDEGTLKLACSTSWGLGTMANSLNFTLKSANVEMPEPVKASGNTIIIRFRKKFPWLAVIVGAIIGISLLYIIITNWELVKDTAGALAPLAPLIPYIIIGVAIFVGYLWLTKGKTPGLGGI